jgi:hypothetical protein
MAAGLDGPLGLDFERHAANNIPTGIEADTVATELSSLQPGVSGPEITASGQHPSSGKASGDATASATLPTGQALSTSTLLSSLTVNLARPLSILKRPEAGLGLRQPMTILDLPPELHRELLGHMSAGEGVLLSLTCRSLWARRNLRDSDCLRECKFLPSVETYSVSVFRLQTRYPVFQVSPSSDLGIILRVECYSRSLTGYSAQKHASVRAHPMSDAYGTRLAQ